MKTILMTLVLATSATAQQNYSGGFYRGFGNWSAGGSVYAYGQMNNTPSSANAYGLLQGNARLFGTNVEAVRGEFKSQNTYGSGSAGVTVKMVGYTVYSQNLAYTWTWSWYRSQTFVSASATFWIGPLPVTVGGNIGGAANANLQLAITPTGAGANGAASAWAFGNAWGGVGVSWCWVGIKVTINLFINTLEAGMNVNFSYVSGYVLYNLEPIRIWLKAGLYTWWGTVGEVTIADYSYAKWNWYLTKTW
jgi:hypothetical protein